jgi:predicted outer membrane repeat protein
MLEDRTAPAAVTITVTSLAGLAGSYSAGTQQATTLAAAVRQANADNDGDTIVFASTLHGAVDLNPNDPGNAGAVGTLTLTGSMTIEGPSNNAITIEGGKTAKSPHNVQVLSIASGVTANLDNLAITDGYTTSIATTAGGAVGNSGSLTATNCTFAGNATGSDATGAGINNFGTSLTLTNCAFDDNVSSSPGGGIYCVDCSMTLMNCTFDSNSADPFGGGISDSSGDRGGTTLTLTDCTFHANTAASQGGGIYTNNVTLVATNCTFDGNSATYFGGGIDNNATATVTNCTFANNSCPSGDGGGIYTVGTLTVISSTFDNNSAPGHAGGGILDFHVGNVGGSVTLLNTVLANDPGGDYVGGPVVSTSANNLIQVDDGSGLGSPNGNITGAVVTNVGLDPSGLQNNGGPTETIALLPGSQAIAAGSNGVLPSTDERGVPRTANQVDIGAYQSLVTVSAATLPVGTVGDDYTQTTLTAAGGTAPYAFHTTFGTFPPGLTLAPDGTLSGVPTEAGVFTFAVAAQDASTGPGPFTGSQVFTVTVMPTTPTVTVTDTGGSYNGQPFAAMGSATGVDGVTVKGTFTYTYYVGATVNGTGSSTPPSRPGTYTVVAAFASSDPSYGDGTSDPVPFNIINPTPFAGTYTGSFSGGAIHGHIAFTVDGTGAVSVTNPGSGQGTVTSAGGVTLSGVATLGSSSNVAYTCTGTIVIPATGLIAAQGTWTATVSGASVSGTWTATRAPVQAIVMASDAGGTYTGHGLPASATAMNANSVALKGSFTFTYYAGTTTHGAGSATAPVHAGTYTVVAKFISGDPNYTNTQSGAVSFTVAPAAPIITVTKSGGMYNGRPVPATAGAVGLGGAVVKGSITYSYFAGGPASSVPPTNAGSYSVVAAFASANTDYTGGQSSTTTFSISPATPKVTVKDAGGIYSSQPFPATATATGLGGTPVGGSFNYHYYTGKTATGPASATAPIIPGTYTVVADFSSSGANYTGAASAPLTFTIALGSALDAAGVLITLSKSGTPGELNINYWNTGSSDVGAPLLLLSTSQANVTFTLPGHLAPEKTPYILAGDPNGGLFGALPAGFTNTIVVQYAPGTATSFALKLQSKLSTPFAWTALAANVPPGETAADWSSLIQAAKSTVGNTWGNVLTAIDQNVSVVPGVDGDGVVEGTLFYDFDALLPYLAASAATNLDPTAPSGQAGADAVTPELFGSAQLNHGQDLPAGFQAVATDTGNGVAVYSSGTPVTNPSHTYVVSHGLGGLSSTYANGHPNRWFALANALRAADPQANVFVVDWTPGADQAVPAVGIPLPWPASASIDQSADAIQAILQNDVKNQGGTQVVFNPANTTFIGESFGNDVLARVASDFQSKGLGQIGTGLIYNPANNMGGYAVPDFTKVFTQSMAFITPSVFDQQHVVANYVFPLNDVPAGTTFHFPLTFSYYAHTHGVVWLGNQIGTQASWWTKTTPPQAQLLVTPTAAQGITFTQHQGRPNPAPQGLTVQNAGPDGIVLTYTLSVSYTSPAPVKWLSVTGPALHQLASAAAVNGFLVAAGGSGLTPGTYTATITITATSSAANSPQVIPVTFIVKPATVGATYSGTFNVSVPSQNSPTYGADYSESFSGTITVNITSGHGTVLSPYTGTYSINATYTSVLLDTNAGAPTGVTIQLNNMTGGISSGSGNPKIILFIASDSATFQLSFGGALSADGSQLLGQGTRFYNIVNDIDMIFDTPLNQQ